jgi:hypothetical protein
MSDIEKEEKTGKEWAKIIIPRVLRAVIWGFIMGGEMLLLLNLPQFLPEIGEEAMGMIPTQATANLSYFFMIFAGIEIAIQLLRGTIFPYPLSMVRSLISIILLVQMTNGGVMTITMQPPAGSQMAEGATIMLTLDFQPVLGVIIILSLVSIVKNLLQAVDHLSRKEEEGPPPELP